MSVEIKSNDSVDSWWEARRLSYNVGLVVSGVLAFIAYAVVGFSIVEFPEDDFEITLFTIFFQGIGYIIMMLIANVFYLLGAVIDKHYNRNNEELFRKRLHKFGFWFSFALPFSIPILLILSYPLQ